MPLPFLIAAGAAVFATSVGAYAHKDAKETNERAQSLSRQAQRLYDDAKMSLTATKDDAEKKLLKLGYEKKGILDGSMKQFVGAYDRIKNIQIKESVGLDEISNFTIEQQDVVQVREMSTLYSDAVVGGATGAATGALIGLAASGSLPLVTGALSLAGTFLSVGSVGAAASMAGMALTTAASATPLAAVVAPAVFVSGISASMKADENEEKAEEMYAEAKKAAEEMRTAATVCEAIGERSEMFNELLDNLNGMFSDCTDMLCDLIRKKDKQIGGGEITGDDLSDDERELVAVTRALAGAVKAVIDTPILNKEGKVMEESYQFYADTQKSLPFFAEATHEVRNAFGEEDEKNYNEIGLEMIERSDPIKLKDTDTIEAVCQEFISLHEEMGFSQKNIGHTDPNNETVLLTYEDALSQHVWSGFSITDCCVWWKKNSDYEVHSLEWSEFTGTEVISFRGNSLYANKTLIAYCSIKGKVKEEIRDLFRKIFAIIQREKKIRTDYMF